MEPTEEADAGDRFPVDLWEDECVTVLEALDAFLATNPRGKLARTIFIKNKISAERDQLALNDDEMELIMDALHFYRNITNDKRAALGLPHYRPRGPQDSEDFFHPVPGAETANGRMYRISALINRFNEAGMIRYSLSEYGSWEAMPDNPKRGLKSVLKTSDQIRQAIRKSDERIPLK